MYTQVITQNGIFHAQTISEIKAINKEHKIIDLVAGCPIEEYKEELRYKYKITVK